MSNEITRRIFVKESAIASSTLLSAGVVSQLQADQPAAKTPDPKTPAAAGATWNGKIGKLELSRLMLGGNLLTGAAHSRDLRYVGPLMYRYNTPEKVVETFDLALKNGINSINTHIADRNNHVVKDYRKKNGDRLKWIVAVYATPMAADPFNLIDKAKNEGADAIYLWGVAADGLLPKNMDLLKRTVDRMRATGLPIGIAAHTLKVIVACEKEKIDVDFYQKTFHSRHYPTAQKPEDKADFGNFDNAWCSSSDEVAEVMKNVKKPWIAFKVMAAGAIPPKEAFSYSVNSGADFVLAGMFDFQVAEDAKIMHDALDKVKRTRPWMA
jgi:hypothetical protein